MNEKLSNEEKEKGKKRVQQQQLAVICSTLNDFRNKGAAWQSKIMADRLLVKLKELLPDGLGSK